MCLLDRIRITAAFGLDELQESGVAGSLILLHDLQVGDRLIQQLLDFRIVLGLGIH